MTFLAAMTLSSSTRRMIPFARAFSATNTAAFATNRGSLKVQGNIANNLHKAAMGVNTDGSSSILSTHIPSSTSLYFSTDSSSEEGKDKTSTAIGATVEDDLDTALDEILGAAYKEAGDENVDEEENVDDNDDEDEVEETKMKVDFTDPKFLSTTNQYWLDAGMDQRLIDIMSGKGITAFTEVQGKSFEPVLAGKDLIGRSRTGTGKTIAFGLPSIHRIYRDAEAKGNIDSYGKRRRGRGVSFLVLCPTRELARQVEGELAQLARPLGLYTQVFHGGVSYDPQVS